jgi:hypothetical protein
MYEAKTGNKLFYCLLMGRWVAKLVEQRHSATILFRNQIISQNPIMGEVAKEWPKSANKLFLPSKTIKIKNVYLKSI